MTERATLEAASKLTADDIDHIRRHHKRTARPNATAPSAAESTPEPDVQAESDPPAESVTPATEHATPIVTSPPTPRARGKAHSKRSHIEHPWPPMGSVLTADYFGEHYTALVIPAPASRKLKSGCMIRVTSGAAAGTEHVSMSGAMEAATEEQRKRQDLGRKGCLSGWEFWRWTGKEGAGS